ncbi:hypothetical protein TVAG_140610 [Trichomonas vaginalis G3]|uniref:Glycosyltransferase 61 catalytic domain-containing protein n=1 Tax=Trichomonas vaginalis (strain ATCC PRA-98 / G3) TaxID=412133 RepID=A2EJU9_TRIV3|nr:glycosyltransferase family [Trichomonas vaginalis G3]EAY07087.1 hypothetical protein TVAG_140610 [Trichomonas vaginalis G3]KAI5535237.1 glycosyltransferase family [Trichomonas vaginalis G3]|eukprot:XP_001319310.1 hypothetical protein [Trichomonas vaginalis G3]
MEIPNTEFIENFTANFHPGLDNRIYVSHTTSNEGHKFSFNGVIVQHVRYYHCKGANIATKGVVVQGKLFYPARHYIDVPQIPPKPHSFNCYDKVVVGFSYHLEYGHFIQDMLCGILVIPSEIALNAEIFVKFRSDIASKYFEFIGFNGSRVHELTDEWIYANDMYMAVSDFGINSLHVSWGHFHDIIYEKYDLEKIVPTQHTIYNKPKGLWGHVSNMPQILEWTRAQYPQYKWIEYDYKTITNLSYVSKVIAATKIFFINSGSCVFNCIYLHKDCGVYILGNNLCDRNVFVGAYTLHLWLINVASPGFRWHMDVPTEFDIDLYKQTLPDFLDAVYKGAWPKDVSKRSKKLFDAEEVFRPFRDLFVRSNNVQFVRKVLY